MRSASTSAPRRCVIHHGRAAADESLHHRLDEPFALQIDLARGFVEDQERRIAEDCPSQGDSLPLPAGKLTAQRPDDGIVTVGQFPAR